MNDQIMKIRWLGAALFWLIPIILLSQNQQDGTSQISKKSFSPTLSFLSSGWMEGREAGERGSFMASDYIAAMMETIGLQPYGDIAAAKGDKTRSYFQTFEMLRYKAENASFSFISEKPGSRMEQKLTRDIDFEVEPGLRSIEAQAPVVFAGYGIYAPELGYDDYKKTDVNGCIVVVLKGFPGHRDSTSYAAKKLPATFGRDFANAETKLRNAFTRGAVALIIVQAQKTPAFFGGKAKNSDLLKNVMNAEKEPEPKYTDEFYHVVYGDDDAPMIPLFRLSDEAKAKLFVGTEISFNDFEKKAAESLSESSVPIKGKSIGISVTVNVEKLLVRNVLGLIPGQDSTKNIIIGAHYDHLGIRNGNIYNGADDNASGTAGMLALAKFWSESAQKPAFNLVFAAWTAEEKGLLGSRYFVDHNKVNPSNTMLKINFDMISRSAPEDSTGFIVSVGTVKGSDNLKTLANKSNQLLATPFALDLWECSEHGGSDYAPFSARKVPVMTFFSGFHNDYHTTQDISGKVDLTKMENILKLANGCLEGFMEESKGD